MAFYLQLAVLRTNQQRCCSAFNLQRSREEPHAFIYLSHPPGTSFQIYRGIKRLSDKSGCASHWSRDYSGLASSQRPFGFVFSEEQEQRKRVDASFFFRCIRGMIVMADGLQCTPEAPWEPPGRVEGVGCPDMEQSSIFFCPSVG